MTIVAVGWWCPTTMRRYQRWFWVNIDEHETTDSWLVRLVKMGEKGTPLLHCPNVKREREE